MPGDQPLGQRGNQLLSNAAAPDPAHIKGVLMGEGVVVQKLHRHRRRELFGGFEQTHQQDRPQEFIDHPLADPQLAEQAQGIETVVTRKGVWVAVQIEHGDQQPGDAQTVGNGESFEVVHRGEGLTQGAGQLGAIAEHRCSGLQTIRGPEGAGGEWGEHITPPQFGR